MISIVIPVYNAEEIIFNAYKKVKKEIEKITNEYEILLRNDASTDQSLGVLQNIAEKDSKVRIFSNDVNRGIGYVLQRLFADAKGEILIYLDADLSFDIRMLPTFLDEIKKVDVVVASKYKGAKKVIPLQRLLASRIYYLINKILFRINVTDVGSGFIMFRKNVLNSVELSSSGFEAHIEFFVKLKESGFKVKEIPVDYNHRNAGSFNMLKHGPPTVARTFKFWWQNLWR
ncbi:MAG: glycosyltransferase family 2 protein [Candidatus Hydrothermarchaeota archaeon]|nr:glycosyltransferase family 2 protein [Candidatus Hydrothermarchaeota archaeon]